MELNHFIDNFVYTPDKFDSWRVLTPDQDGKFRGDCDDFAVSCLFILAGSWRQFWFKLLTGQAKIHFVTVGNSGHAVLQYGDFYIDNIFRRYAARHELIEAHYKFNRLRMFWCYQVAIKMLIGKFIRWWMPFHIEGKNPTVAELKAYAEKLEKQWLEISQEILAMSDDDIKNENAIKLLSLKQDRMADDIKEINSAIKEMASAIRDLAVLEQKHTESMEAIRRSHARIDRIENEFQDSRKSYENEVKTTYREFNKRINNLELHNAKMAWLERIGSWAVIAVLGFYIKGF